jgi:hypothetical protein
MRKLLIQFFLVLLCGTATAQTGTSSPYSSAALGELQFGGFTQHMGKGGLSRAEVSKNNFSPLNPATYANIDFTVYDAGMKTNFGTLQTSTDEAAVSAGNFSHFGMAFPFNTPKGMGVSFGLYQYTDVGYDIRNAVNDAVPSYYNLFRGNGGINRVYAGYGVEIFKNLNLGVNFNYNFGSIQSLSAKVYPNTDTHFSLSDEEYITYRGLDLDFGVQYTLQTKQISHTLAATFSPGTTLNGNGYRYSETFFGRKFEQGTLTSIDTIAFEDNVERNANKPMGYGLAYTVRNGEKWSLGVEFEQNNWSDVTNDVGKAYFNNTKYAAGLAFVPQAAYDETGNFLKKVRYSAGFRYEDLFYNFFDTQLSEFGISFGLGLPVVKSVRLDEEKVAVVSRVNISAEYARRGTTANGLIQENYFKLGIGLNLNDKWFTKRKYR